MTAAVNEGGQAPPTGFGPDLEVTPLPDGAGWALRGSLDLATVPLARDRLGDLWVQGATVVLDLSGLEFMDSTGLNLFARGLVALGDDGTLVLRAPGGIVRRVLSVSGIEARPNVRVEDA